MLYTMRTLTLCTAAMLLSFASHAGIITVNNKTSNLTAYLTVHPKQGDSYSAQVAPNGTYDIAIGSEQVEKIEYYMFSFFQPQKAWSSSIYEIKNKDFCPPNQDTSITITPQIQEKPGEEGAWEQAKKWIVGQREIHRPKIACKGQKGGGAEPQLPSDAEQVADIFTQTINLDKKVYRKLVNMIAGKQNIEDLDTNTARAILGIKKGENPNDVINALKKSIQPKIQSDKLGKEAERALEILDKASRLLT